jgi:hypothetical protein
MVTGILARVAITIFRMMTERAILEAHTMECV